LKLWPLKVLFADHRSPVRETDFRPLYRSHAFETRGYFRNPAVQFTTTVIGTPAAGSTGVGIRKRPPKGLGGRFRGIFSIIRGVS
jgi:hypothetical protein